MLRLRTTIVLSLLALTAGIAGTSWLSVRSADEPLALPLTASNNRSAPPRHRADSSAARTRGVAQVLRHRSQAQRSAERMSDLYQHEHAAPDLVPPELVPLDMPASRDLAYDRLRGHLDGRVVVRVSVDGSGRVTAASVAESSGDAVLDAHALRSVRGWRFAVPPDYPAGLSADLPMRFSSHDDPVASVP